MKITFNSANKTYTGTKSIPQELVKPSGSLLAFNVGKIQQTLGGKNAWTLIPASAIHDLSGIFQGKFSLETLRNIPNIFSERLLTSWKLATGDIEPYTPCINPTAEDDSITVNLQDIPVLSSLDEQQREFLRYIDVSIRLWPSKGNTFKDTKTADSIIQEGKGFDWRTPINVLNSLLKNGNNHIAWTTLENFADTLATEVLDQVPNSQEIQVIVKRRSMPEFGNETIQRSYPQLTSAVFETTKQRD